MQVDAMLISERDAKALCDKVLGYVTADDAGVSVSSDDYDHFRFAANSFTTCGRREDLSVRVTVWTEGRRGSASANETDDVSLKAVVADAERIARLSPVDPEYLPTLGPMAYKPVQGYVEATSRIDLAARARAVSDAIARCEKQGVIGAGFHQARGAATAAATKNGNFLAERSSLVSLGMTSRTTAGDGSGFFLRNHYDVGRLDTGRVVRESIRKALDSRAPRTLEAGTYTVVLEPQAVADLLGLIGGAFDARSAEEGRSPFSAPNGKTRIGERLFDARLNVYTDPWHPELPGSAAAQGGLPAEKFHLVREGVLETLVYSRFWARHREVRPTPGPANTILESTKAPASLEEMIKETPRGLLVSRFWYIRPVDPRTLLITGLTRDGIWLIEEGRVRHPVRNLRFNQSILQMLAPGNVDLIGAPERVGSSEAQGRAASLLPALKIKAFNFTSQSEAV
jgi:predicted Zn-dependent protease